MPTGGPYVFPLIINSSLTCSGQDICDKQPWLNKMNPVCLCTYIETHIIYIRVHVDMHRNVYVHIHTCITNYHWAQLIDVDGTIYSGNSFHLNLVIYILAVVGNAIMTKLMFWFLVDICNLQAGIPFTFWFPTLLYISQFSQSYQKNGICPHLSSKALLENQVRWQTPQIGAMITKKTVLTSSYCFFLFIRALSPTEILCE